MFLHLSQFLYSYKYLITFVFDKCMHTCINIYIYIFPKRIINVDIHLVTRALTVACNYEYKRPIYFCSLRTSFSADAARATNHPVRTINWVKIIIGLSADIINDRDFEQLISITGSAPHSLLHLLYTHMRLDIISLILEDDIRVMAYYLSYSV